MRDYLIAFLYIILLFIHKGTNVDSVNLYVIVNCYDKTLSAIYNAGFNEICAIRFYLYDNIGSFDVKLLGDEILPSIVQ